MKVRYFKRISTNEWLEPTVGTGGDFTVPPPRHAADVANGYGFAPADIEVVEVEDGPDPRSAILAMPAKPPTPDETELQEIATTLAVSEADFAAMPVADRWLLVYRALRRLHRRGFL